VLSFFITTGTIGATTGLGHWTPKLRFITADEIALPCLLNATSLNWREGSQAPMLLPRARPQFRAMAVRCWWDSNQWRKQLKTSS
jgi:hypothetical protein